MKKPKAGSVSAVISFLEDSEEILMKGVSHEHDPRYDNCTLRRFTARNNAGYSLDVSVRMNICLQYQVTRKHLKSGAQ